MGRWMGVVMVVGVGRKIYSDTPKASDKAHRRRQYAFVRRGDATPYEAFGGLLYIHHYLACPCWYKPVIATGKPVREGFWREMCTV